MAKQSNPFAILGGDSDDDGDVEALLARVSAGARVADPEPPNPAAAADASADVVRTAKPDLGRAERGRERGGRGRWMGRRGGFISGEGISEGFANGEGNGDYENGYSRSVDYHGNDQGCEGNEYYDNGYPRGTDQYGYGQGQVRGGSRGGRGRDRGRAFYRERTYANTNVPDAKSPIEGDISGEAAEQRDSFYHNRNGRYNNHNPQSDENEYNGYNQGYRRDNRVFDGENYGYRAGRSNYDVRNDGFNGGGQEEYGYNVANREFRGRGRGYYEQQREHGGSEDRVEGNNEEHPVENYGYRGGRSNYDARNDRFNGGEGQEKYGYNVANREFRGRGRRYSAQQREPEGSEMDRVEGNNEEHPLENYGYRARRSNYDARNDRFNGGEGQEKYGYNVANREFRGSGRRYSAQQRQPGGSEKDRVQGNNEEHPVETVECNQTESKEEIDNSVATETKGSEAEVQNADVNTGRDVTDSMEAPKEAEPDKILSESKKTKEEVEAEEEAKKMTLGEYEKLRTEKRKLLEAMKTEERIVTPDKELEEMQQLEKKKDEGVFIQLKAEKDKQNKKDRNDKEEKIRKPTSDQKLKLDVLFKLPRRPRPGGMDRGMQQNGGFVHDNGLTGRFDGRNEQASGFGHPNGQGDRSGRLGRSENASNVGSNYGHLNRNTTPRPVLSIADPQQFPVLGTAAQS